MKRATCGKEGAKPARSFICGRSSSKNVHSWIERTKTEGKNRKWVNRGRRVKNSGDDEAESRRKLDDLLDAFKKLQARVNKFLSLSTGESQENFKKHSDLNEVLKKEVLDFNTNNNVLGRLISELDRHILEKYKYINVPEIRLEPLVNDEIHGLDSSSGNPLLLNSNIVDDFPLYSEDNEKRKADPPTSSEITGDYWLPSEIQNNAGTLAGVRSEARQTLENDSAVANDDINFALMSGPSEAWTYPKKNFRKRALFDGNASQGAEAAVGDDSSLAMKRYCEWNWERISQVYGIKWPYQCDKCLGRFINEDILMRHRITHGTDHPSSSWKQLYSIPYNEEAPPIKRRRKLKRKTEFGIKWRQSFIRATRHGRFLRPRKKMNYRVDCADSDSIDSRSVKSPPVSRPSSHRKQKSHLEKSRQSISADQQSTDNTVPDIATEYSSQSSAPEVCIKEQSSGVCDRSSSGALKENEESTRVSTSTDVVNSIRNNSRTSVGSDEDISASISGIDYLGSLFVTTSPKVAGPSDQLSSSPRAIEDQSQSVSEENSIGCHSKEKAHERPRKSHNTGFHSLFKKSMEPRHQEGEQSNISKESSTKETTATHKEHEATVKDESEIVKAKKKKTGLSSADCKRKTNKAMLENSSSHSFVDTPKIPKDPSDSSSGTSESISSIADDCSTDEFSVLRRSKLKKLRVSSSESQENESDSVKDCSSTQRSRSGEKEVIDACTNSVGIGEEKNHCPSNSRNSKTQENLHKASSRTLKDNSNSRKKNVESLDGVSRKVGRRKVQLCSDQRRRSRIDTMECKKPGYPKSSKSQTHRKGDCHGTLKMVSKSSDDETQSGVDERALSKEGQTKFKRDLFSSSSSNSVTIIRANVKSVKGNCSDSAVSKKYQGNDPRSLDSSPSTRSNPDNGSDTDSSKVRTPNLSAPKTYKPLKFTRRARPSSSSSSGSDSSRDELKRALNTSECNNKKRMLIQILSNSQSRGIIARARGRRQHSSDRNEHGPTASNASKHTGMESSKSQKIARRRSTSALGRERNHSAHNSNGTADSEESGKSISNSDTEKISKSIQNRDANERQDLKSKKKSRTSSSHSNSRTSIGGNKSSELKSSAPSKMNKGSKRRSEIGAKHRSSSHSVDDERINRGTKSSPSYPAVEKSTKSQERNSSQSTEAASRKVSTVVEKTSKALCKEATNEKSADDVHSNPKTVEKAKCARKDKEGNASTAPSVSSRKHHHSVHGHVTKAAKDMHSNPETFKAKSQKENKKRSLSSTSSGHERDSQVKTKEDGFKIKVSHSADIVTGKSPINSKGRSRPEKKTASKSSGHLADGKKKDEGGKQDGLDTDTVVESKRDACLQSKVSGTSSHNRHQSMDKDPTQAGSILSNPEKSKAAKPHKDNRKRCISAEANTSLGHKYDFQVKTKRELFKGNISRAAGDETSKSKINAKGSSLEKKAECPSSNQFSNGKKKVEGREQSGYNPATVGDANKDKYLQATASSTSSHNRCHSVDEHPTQAAKNIDSNSKAFKAGKSENGIEKIFLPAESSASSAHRHKSQAESKKQGFKSEVSHPAAGEALKPPMNSKGSRPLKQKKECRFCDTTNGKGKDENGKQHSSSPAALGEADKVKCLQASAQSTIGHNSHHSGSTQPTSSAIDILSNPEESRAKKHQKDHNKRSDSAEASLVHKHDSQAKTKTERDRSKGSRSASGKRATSQMDTKESSPAKKKAEGSSSGQFSNGERKDKGSEQPGSTSATIEVSNKEKCLESKASHNCHRSVDRHPTQGARSSHTNPEASRPKKHNKKSCVSVDGSSSSGHKHDPQVKTKSRVSNPDDGAKSQMNTKASRPPKEKKEGSSSSHLNNGKNKDENCEQNKSDPNAVVEAKKDECPRSKATDSLIHQSLSSHPTKAGKIIHSNPEAFKAGDSQEDNRKINLSADDNSPTGHKHNSQDDTGKEDFKSNIYHPAAGETVKSPMNNERSRPPENKHESSSSWNLTNVVEKSEGCNERGSDPAVVGEVSEDKIRPENIDEMSRESNGMNLTEINQSKARKDESYSMIRANMSHNNCNSEGPSTWEVCTETPNERAAAPSVVRTSETKVDQKSSGSTVPLTCSNSSQSNDVCRKDAKAISLNTPLKETSMKDVSGVGVTEASEETTGSSSNDLKNISNVSRQNCLPSDVHFSEHSTSTSNAAPIDSKETNNANSHAASELPNGKSDVQIDAEGSPKCDFSQSSNDISSSGSTLEGADHRSGCVNPNLLSLIPLIAKLRGKPVVVFNEKCSYKSDLDPVVVKSSTFQRDAGRINISSSLTSSVGSDRGFSRTHSNVCSEESGNGLSQNVSKPCVSMVTSQDSTTVGEPYEIDKVAEPSTCGKSGTSSECESKNIDSESKGNLSPVKAPVSHKDGERKDALEEQSTSNNVGCVPVEQGCEVHVSNVSNPATEERSSFNEDLNESLRVPASTAVSELDSHSITGISANLSEDAFPKPSIPPSFMSNYCFINNNQHSLSVPYDSLNEPLDFSQKVPGETASSSVSPVCISIDSAKVWEQNRTHTSLNHAAESYAPTTSSSSRYSSRSKSTPENVSGSSSCINLESKQRYSEENQLLFSDETQTRNQSLSIPSAEHPESLNSHENHPKTLPNQPRFYDDPLNRGGGASGYCINNLTSANMDFSANSNSNEGIPGQSHLSSRKEDPEKNPSKTIPSVDSRSSVSPNDHSTQVLPYSSRFRFAIFRGNWSTSDTGSCKVHPRPEETVSSQNGSRVGPSSDSCRHESVDKLNNLVSESGGVCPVDQSSSMFQNPAGSSLDTSQSVSVNSFDFPGIRNFTSTPGKVEWKVIPMSLDPPDPTKPIPREIHFKDGTSTSVRLGYSCEGEVSEAQIRLIDFLSKVGIMHVKETNPSAIPVKFSAVKERSASSISISHANNRDERPKGKVVDPIAVSTSEHANESQNASTLIFDRFNVNEEISGSKILHRSVEGAFKCGTDAPGGPSVEGSEDSSPSSSSNNIGCLLSMPEDNHAGSSSSVIHPSNSALPTSYANAVMPEKETQESSAVANSTSSRDSRYQSETNNHVSQIRSISTVTDAGEGTSQKTSFTCTGMRRGSGCSENEEFALTQCKRRRMELGKSEILMDVPESPRDGNSWQKCTSTDLYYRIVRCQESRRELSWSTSLNTATTSKHLKDDVRGSELAAISREASFSAESRTHSDNSGSITSNLSVSSSRCKEDAERSETSRVPTISSGSKIEESSTRGSDIDPEDGVKIEEENCCGVTPEVVLISESAVEDSCSNSSTLKPTVGLNDGVKIVDNCNNPKASKPVAVINIDLTAEEDGASKNADNAPVVMNGAVKVEEGVAKSSPSKPVTVINIDLTAEEDGASRNADNPSGVVSGAVKVEEVINRSSASKPVAVINIDLTTEEDGANRNAENPPGDVSGAVKVEEGVTKSSASEPAAVLNIDLTTEEDGASRNAENPPGDVSGAVKVEEVINRSSASKPVAVINIDLTTEEDGANRNAENPPGDVSGAVKVEEVINKSSASEPVAVINIDLKTEEDGANRNAENPSGVVSGAVKVEEGVAKSSPSEPAAVMNSDSTTEEGGTNRGDERPAALLKGDLKMESECTNCSDMSFAVSTADPTIEESCSNLSGVRPRGVLNAHLTIEEDGANRNAVNAAAVSNSGVEIEKGGTFSSCVKALAVTNGDSTTEEDGANRKSSKPAAISNSGTKIGKDGTKGSTVTPEVILITESTIDRSCSNGSALKLEAACNSNSATEGDGANRIGMSPTAILNIKSTTEVNGKDSSAVIATPTLSGGANIEEDGGGVKPTAVLNSNSTTKGDNSIRKDVNPAAVLNNSIKIEEVGTVSIGVKEAAVASDRRSKKYGTNARSAAVLNCRIQIEDGSCCSAVNASATRTSEIQTDSSKASINSIPSSLTKPSNGNCNHSLKGYPNGSKQN